MYYKADIKTEKETLHVEFEQFPQATVVALGAKLDDFKGVPVKDNTGRESLRFAAKTTKDCTKIDGAIYMCLGMVADNEIVRRIGMFQKALNDKKLWTPVSRSEIVI